MKVEQILYTRLGGSELGAGWQARKSDHFNPDTERSCVYYFNLMVDSMLDKSGVSPDTVYAQWHSNKRICSARAIKIKDQTGRGNLLAHAYAVDENEYISVLSKPANFVCINSFSDEMIEEPQILDALPPADAVRLKDVCRKYEITSDKMQQLMLLILSSVLGTLDRSVRHNGALKIVISAGDAEIYNASREIMTAIYSFMPCIVRLNTPFASYAHEKLESMAVLFTNKKPGSHYYDISTGEWNWPSDKLISIPDMARVFVDKSSDQAFQRDIENYVIKTGQVSESSREGIQAAFLYAAIKNRIEISVTEEELFKALGIALKGAQHEVQDEYIACLVKYYIDMGEKVASSHAEQLLARYNKTKSRMLAGAIEYYNYNNYVVNFDDKKFAAFCSMQRVAPEFYDSTVKFALEKNNKFFLDKVCTDVIRSKETYTAFSNSTSNTTKGEIYEYMINNIFLKDDSPKYAEFAKLRKNIPQLYGILHGIALSGHLQKLKRFYNEYHIPKEANGFDMLVSIKETFGPGYDEELENTLEKRAGEIFAQRCKDGASPNVFVEYRNTLHKLGMDMIKEQQSTEWAKGVFWETFNLTSWNARDSYMPMSDSRYLVSDSVANLEYIANKLSRSGPGERIYGNISELMVNNEFSIQEKAHIFDQLRRLVSAKLGYGNVDDMVIMAIDPGTMNIDLRKLANALTDRRNNIYSSSALEMSVLLVHALRTASYRQLYEMYEELVAKRENDNSRLVKAFQRVCSQNNIAIGRIQKDVSKRTRKRFTAVTFGMIFVSLSCGAGIGLVNEIMGLGSMGTVAVSVINIVAVLIAMAVITIPALPFLSNGKIDVAAAVAAAVLVVSMIALGAVYVLPAAVIAVIMLALSWL